MWNRCRIELNFNLTANTYRGFYRMSFGDFHLVLSFGGLIALVKGEHESDPCEIWVVSWLSPIKWIDCMDGEMVSLCLFQFSSVWSWAPILLDIGHYHFKQLRQQWYYNSKSAMAHIQRLSAAVISTDRTVQHSVLYISIRFVARCRSKAFRQKIYFPNLRIYSYSAAALPIKTTLYLHLYLCTLFSQSNNLHIPLQIVFNTCTPILHSVYYNTRISYGNAKPNNMCTSTPLPHSYRAKAK